MPVTRTIDVAADDKKQGMTLDELARFVQDALRDGAAGSEVPEVTTVGLARPRIKSAKVTINPAATHEG